MALIKCTSKGGRHSWTPGPWRKSKCIRCNRKWTDLQQVPEPETPLKVMMAEVLDRLKESKEQTKLMPLVCTCCPVHRNNR